MIKVNVYKPCPNIYQSKSKRVNPFFCSSNKLEKSQVSTDILNVNKNIFFFDWVKDANISKALSQLKNLRFDEDDVKHVQSLGVILPFFSGEEAVAFMRSSNTRIKFDKLDSKNIHAKYDFEDNCIKINEIYKYNENPAVILAIAEAILHEAGHAKDQNGSTSVQEELNCLSMNALSHRVFSKKYPNVFLHTDSLIVKDGVCVYADLFFDTDSTNARLIERLRQKYGDLPAGDLNHPPGKLALEVKGL